MIDKCVPSKYLLIVFKKIHHNKKIALKHHHQPKTHEYDDKNQIEGLVGALLPSLSRSYLSNLSSYAFYPKTNPFKKDTL